MSEDDSVQVFSHFKFIDDNGDRRTCCVGWDDLPGDPPAPTNVTPVEVLAGLARQNRTVEFTPYGDGTVSVAVDNCIVADGHPDDVELWEVLARQADY